MVLQVFSLLMPPSKLIRSLVHGVTFPSSVSLGSAMHLKVVAAGDQLSGYVNDTLVEKVQDPTLTSGYVGFGLGANQKEEVFFENAKVTIKP